MKDISLHSTTKCDTCSFSQAITLFFNQLDVRTFGLLFLVILCLAHSLKGWSGGMLFNSQHSLQFIMIRTQQGNIHDPLMTPKTETLGSVCQHSLQSQCCVNPTQNSDSQTEDVCLSRLHLVVLLTCGY